MSLWKSLLGIGGDILGGVAGFELGGPVGAALGAEAGGTLGGLAGGEKIGQAALTALPGAALAGLGGYGAEAGGLATPATGTDLLGVSGTGAFDSSGAPIPVSAVTSPTAAAPTLTGAGGSLGDFSALTSLSPITVGDLNSTLGVANPAGGTGWYDPNAQVTQPTWTDTSAGSAASYEAGGALKAATAAGDGSSGGGMLSGISDTLGIKNSSLLPAGIAALGLGKSFLSNNTVKGVNPLTTQAGQLATTGANLQSYLATGTLPPGLQTGVNQAVQSAKASIRAAHAAAGDSGSTAEAAELANVDQTAAAQSGQLAASLLDQGLNATQISAQIYQSLVQTDTQQSAATGQAISSLASALSGSPNITIGKVA